MKGTLISILVGALAGVLLTVGSAVHAAHGPPAPRAAPVADPTTPQIPADVASAAAPAVAVGQETALER